MRTVGLLAMVVVLAAGSARAQEATPTPVPCGVLRIEVTEAARCAQFGHTEVPCFVKCGRLCWKPARGIWEWRRDAKGCPMFPFPTPTPGPMACNPPACRTWGTGVCMNPCPYQTPTPMPTAGATPTPGRQSPCDAGLVGWCLTWSPESDSVICARCSRF